MIKRWKFISACHLSGSPVTLSALSFFLQRVNQPAQARWKSLPDSNRLVLIWLAILAGSILARALYVVTPFSFNNPEIFGPIPSMTVRSSCFTGPLAPALSLVLPIRSIPISSHLLSDRRSKATQWQLMITPTINPNIVSPDIFHSSST